MSIQMQFVVSVLGQDIFYNGSGDVTSNIYGAQIYTTFASAEIGAGEASFYLQRDYGSRGWEIRTIGVGV
jgi:hypothetical protein